MSRTNGPRHRAPIIHRACIEALESRQLLSTVLFDDFEGPFPGNWTVGNDKPQHPDTTWGSNNAKKFSGQWSAFGADNDFDQRTIYDDDLDTYMRQTVSLANAATATLSFKYWVNLEDFYDYFYVEVRGQDGVWNTLVEETEDQNGDGWQNKIVDLTEYAGQTSVEISFELFSDASVRNDAPSGVWVDDVLVTIDEGGGDPPPIVNPGTGTWIWTNPFGELNRPTSIVGTNEVDFYAFMPDVSGNYDLYTTGALDSMIRLYDDLGDPVTGIIDDTAGGETITEFLDAGYWYYIAVAGSADNVGDYNMRILGPESSPFTVNTNPPSHHTDVSASIDYGGDIDWFKITAPVGENIVDLTSIPGAALDSRIEIYNSSGTLLASNDDGGLAEEDFLLEFPVTENAVYYVAVLGSTRDSTGSFTLSVDFGQAAIGDPPDTIDPDLYDLWVWPGPFGELTESDAIFSSDEYYTYLFIPEVTGNHRIATTGPLDSQLRLYDANGNALSDVVDAFIGGESMNRVLNMGDFYYIVVAGHGVETGQYNFSIEGPTPTHHIINTPAPTFVGTASGTVAYNGDREFYRITIPTGATSLDLTLTPAFDVDGYMELFDDEGNLLETIHEFGDGVVDSLSNIDITGMSGDLYVAIASNWADQTGALHLEVDFNPDNVGIIRGRKWLDRNTNGAREPDEPGLANWTIYIDSNDNGAFDPGEPTTLTDVNGNYEFINVAPGLYRIAEVLQPGWLQMFPGSNGAAGLTSANVAGIGSDGALIHNSLMGSGDPDPNQRFEEMLFAEFLTSGKKWPQPGGLGAPIVITYSYSNLLDGNLIGLTPDQVKSAIEEALDLWATFAPITFLEIPDIGPLPSDETYIQVGAADLRFGHHFIDGGEGANTLAHAIFPPPGGGNLAGDVHFDNGNTWSLGQSFGAADIIETAVHEIGHALGLDHEPAPPSGNNAIMNPILGRRYSGLGGAFLLPDDIAGIQAIYGTSLPRAGTWRVSVTAGSTIADVDFGNFPTVFNGTDDGDDFTLRLDVSNPNHVEILHFNQFGEGTLYTIDRALLPSLEFHLGGGNDRLIFDSTSGNPFPSGGVVFTGGAGTDDLNFNGGAHTLNFDLASTGFENVLLQGPASLTLTTSQHIPFLNLQGSGTVTLAPSAEFIRLSALNLWPGTTLDLTDNALIFDSGSIEFVTEGITGNTITSTSGGANRRLGAIVNTGRTSFSGESNLVGGEILVLHTLIGDLNLDRQVSIADFLALAGHFNQSPATWGDGDINYDNTVTIADFLALAGNFGQTYSGSTTPVAQPALASVTMPAVTKTKKIKKKPARHHLTAARPRLQPPARALTRRP
jgi:hypothetical protein